jgi:hypothetical protein
MNILLHPVYFPNIAHCVAMVHAEEVTFETDDNFQKQTYRNRTYIYDANGKLILNIPVIHTQKNRQKYRDVKIAKNTKWQALHWKSLQSAYRTSPFFEFYEDDLRPLFHLKTNYIMDFNLKCFEVVSECLQLDLKVNTTETYEHIVEDKTDLRHLVNAKNESLFGFDTYTQVFCEKHGFISNLSILDLLFNEGTNALHYLESQTLKQ